MFWPWHMCFQVFNISCLQFEMNRVMWRCWLAHCQVAWRCSWPSPLQPGSIWSFPLPLTSSIWGHGRTIKGALAIDRFQRPSIGEAFCPASAQESRFFYASVLLSDSVLRTSMPANSIGAATRRVLHVLPWPFEEAGCMNCTISWNLPFCESTIWRLVAGTTICRWKQFEPPARATSQAGKMMADGAFPQMSPWIFHSVRWWNMKVPRSRCPVQLQARIGNTYHVTTRAKMIEKK